MTIISKRHPLKFYLLVCFGSLFILALGIFIIHMSILEFEVETPEPKVYILPVLGVILVGFAVAMPWVYFKNAPQITIDKHSITFGKERISFTQIDDIAITGKMPFKFIFSFPMEGSAILLKNGTEKFLYDDFYINSATMKLFLQQVVLDKKEFTPLTISKVNPDAIRFEEEEHFKGNALLSFRGLTLWGMIGFLVFISMKKANTMNHENILTTLGIGLMWFFLHSWFMYYFGVTQNYLVIRNHNYFWKVILYRLDDVLEVVFESHGRQPNGMRVITKDFKHKFYLAGTLSDKTWLSMKRRLESKGIRVRNESIY